MLNIWLIPRIRDKVLSTCILHAKDSIYSIYFFYLIIKFFRSLAVTKKNFPKMVLFIKKLCSKVFKCHYSGCPTHYFHLHFHKFRIKGVNINLRKLVQWKEQSLRIFCLYPHLMFFINLHFY